jgi:hypothetical protein
MNTISYTKTNRILLTILAFVLFASLAMAPAQTKTASAASVPSCMKNCLRVTDIFMTKVSPSITESVVTAIVTVKQINPESVQGAQGVQIYAIWTYPDGSQSKALGTTDRAGRAIFRVPDQPGVFTFTISDVQKAKCTFDRINSVLTKSIK